MDKLGATRKLSVNRDHWFLSRLFNWPIERDYLKSNPCEYVKKFVEDARDRYIEDWEYWLVYEVALRSSYPWIAPMMEIAYLCRMRDGEVRGLMENQHIRKEGIFVERGKAPKMRLPPGHRDSSRLWKMLVACLTTAIHPTIVAPASLLLRLIGNLAGDESES